MMASKNQERPSTSDSLDTVTPFLDSNGHAHEEEEEESRKEKWWNKILDVEEAKKQILFFLPMILTSGCYYFITLIGVMFAGHLGELELAGATLANSWCNLTFSGLLTGLSGALETLCGQGFGAKSYRMLGIYLQACCIISFAFSVIVSIIWFYNEPIFILLNQEPQIAKAAALYLKYLIPGIFAYGIIQNTLRFLQTQSVVTPLIFLSGIPTCIEVGLAYLLVNRTTLGYRGAALSVSISLWISAISLISFVLFSKKFKETWQGFSFESFRYILVTFKLAVSSATMIILETGAFEILVILAGMMPNSEVTTSLIALCVNTEGIAFMCAYGMSAAVSTRVSNELGADNPTRAKNAMYVTLKLSLCLAAVFILALGFGHRIWAGLFSSSSTIIDAFSSFTPLLATSITLDTFFGILSGVVRGCGWQNVAVYVNLGTFYFIGMTTAALLGFLAKLYTKGLWIGLICGLFFDVSILLLVALRKKWIKIDLSEGQKKENSDIAA